MIKRSELAKALVLMTLSFALIWMGALGSNASPGGLYILMIPAAVPLLTLRRLLGRSPFFLVGAGLTFLFLGMKLPTAAFTFLSLVGLVGVFVEFRKRHYSVNEAAGFSLVTAILALGTGFFIWKKNVGPQWLESIEGAVQASLGMIFKDIPKEEFPVSAAEIMQQLPSMAVICLIMALFSALLFEKSMIRLFSLRMAPINFGFLKSFKVPGFFVWFFIGSVAFAFLDLNSPVVKSIGINLLNILVAVYFIQGLGVITHYFATFRVGLVWRVLWITFLVLQLAILVSLIGLVDYWVDFRAKFAKKATQLRKTS